KLATYAARCVENEILMHLRSTKKVNKEILLEESIGSDKEGNEINLMDILSANEESILEKVEQNINIEKLYNKLGDLSKRERKVLCLRYGLNDSEELTQREVASILGISRSYVSRIEKKAINNLSELFIQEEYR
ncbi:MAG: sigma-70 family RNA polymerase sigma factor, partial [bacterium]